MKAMDDTLQHESSKLIRTLILNGYHFDSIQRLLPEHALFNFHTFDVFGGRVSYTLLLSTTKPTASIVSMFTKPAANKRSSPILLSEIKIDGEFSWYDEQGFYRLLRGSINSGLILVPNLPDVLDSLGLNSLPDGLEGDP